MQPASDADAVTPYERLKQAILAGELPPGRQLVEKQLAQWCGVSRTPVREALRRLEQDGLIHHVEGALVVRARSLTEILDIYETRTVLEATVARVAADRRTDHDLRVLRVVLGRGQSVPADDIKGMVDANQRFHRTLWQASHSESLLDLLERLNLHLARFPETTLAAPGRWDAARSEHRLIVDAIEQRRAGDAHDLALEHFTEARDIRLALFADEAANHDGG